MKLQESLNKMKLDINKISKKDLDHFSLEELAAEKKSVKNELKIYDSAFQNIFKRYPERTEKEPMRPLYIYYKKLKQIIIKVCKSDGDSHKQSKDSLQNCTNNNKNLLIINEKENKTSSLDKKDNSLDKKLTVSTKEVIVNNFINTNINENITNKSTTQQTSQEQLKRSLEEIKVKRSQLREKLHNYQIEFTRNHNRKIRYHKDIEPVEEEYKRYKEIKSEIARLESIIQR